MKRPRKPNLPEPPIKPEKFIITRDGKKKYLLVREIISNKKAKPLLLQIIKLVHNSSRTADDFDIADYEYNSGFYYHLCSKEQNPVYEARMSEYKDKYKKYQLEVKEYKDKLKKYEIDLQLYKVYAAKKKEEKLAEEILSLEKKLGNLKKTNLEKYNEIINKKNIKNEKTKTTK